MTAPQARTDGQTPPEARTAASAQGGTVVPPITSPAPDAPVSDFGTVHTPHSAADTVAGAVSDAHFREHHHVQYVPMPPSVNTSTSASSKEDTDFGLAPFPGL